MLDCCDDVVGDRAFVEHVRASKGDLAQGGGQVGIRERRPHDREIPVGKEQLGGVGELPEPCLVRGGLLPEGLIDPEAAGGQEDRGLHGVPQGRGAESVERRLPCGQSARHADRQPRGDHVGEGVGQARARIDERRLGHGGRRRLAPVDGGDLARRRIEVHEVPAAADAGTVRLGDAERCGGRDSGIGGVAALSEHLESGSARFGVNGCHGTAVSRRRRRVRRRRAPCLEDGLTPRMPGRRRLRTRRPSPPRERESGSYVRIDA